MARSRRTRWFLAALLATLAAAGFLAWRLFVPRPRVLVGTSFARAAEGGLALRRGQPIRLLLSWPRRFDRAGFVELELHHLRDGDHVLQVIPIRAAQGDDEVVFAMPDVTQLVGARRGRFRAVFVRDGERLAAADFVVAPP